MGKLDLFYKAVYSGMPIHVDSEYQHDSLITAALDIRIDMSDATIYDYMDGELLSARVEARKVCSTTILNTIYNSL